MRLGSSCLGCDSLIAFGPELTKRDDRQATRSGDDVDVREDVSAIDQWCLVCLILGETVLHGVGGWFAAEA